jgi:drug/metabolite transporter (DMT)-like permease
MELKRAYLYIHIAVLLFGFTAILGDLIQLSAYWLVWWRVLIASAAIPLVLGWKRIVPGVSRELRLKYAGIGVLVALHWVTFYGAIKLSNASLAVVCLATTSFMTSIMEPLILGSKFRWYEMLLGLLIVPGMLLIVQGSPEEYNLAILVGLISALLASSFAILNKAVVETNEPMVITFYELGSSWLFLLLLSPLVLLLGDPGPLLPERGIDWLYIALLTFLCTNLAYVLVLKALKHVSAFASNLTINLEPVYGVIMGWLILNDSEELNVRFYIGAGIIVCSVMLYPVIRKWRKKRNLD